MRKLEFVVAAFSTLALSQAALAQGHDRDDVRVPPGQRPSPGMCRIWINGVPPGRQPAQTDCATARANLPRNATIIYGGGPERRVYESNGTVIAPNGTVIPSRIPNGTGGYPSRIPNTPYPNTAQYPYGYPSQVVNPVVWMGGRQCVQYTDAAGRVQYNCASDAVNRQLACNANPGSNACTNAYINNKKHKKHKDKDHDGD